MSSFDLWAYFDAERRAVDEALARAVSLPSAPQAVAAPLRYAVAGGGKRIRPILCVAAYRAFRSPAPAAIYDLAASLELIHTYSLVHDDLPSMDDDSVRRGRDATHIAHGVPAATVAGAALIPLAVRVASLACEALGLEAHRRAAVLHGLCAAAGAGGMVGGQVLDLEAEGQALTVDELAGIHRRKTGALLGVAPVMGGIAAGARATEQTGLETFGASLGLAFQIADDILDVTATTAVLGKTAGRDDALAKATFAGVTGIASARTRAHREVDTALAALDAAGIVSEELVALARFAAEREH